MYKAVRFKETQCLCVKVRSDYNKLDKMTEKNSHMSSSMYLNVTLHNCALATVVLLAALSTLR